METQITTPRTHPSRRLAWPPSAKWSRARAMRAWRRSVYTLLVGVQNGATAGENSSAVPQKARQNYRRPGTSTTRHIPTRVEHGSSKTLCSERHSHTSQNAEITQVSVDRRRVNEAWPVHTTGCREGEVLTPVTTWMNT